MRIAFVGHSHHRTTRSSAFMLDLLARLGEVSCFWEEGWAGGGGTVDPEEVLAGAFDAIAVWQVEEVAEALGRSGHGNVTFFPMFDGCHDRPDRFWRGLGDAKVLSFSSTLYARVRRLGVRARFARWFPDPGAWRPVDHGGGLRGHFWQRRQDVTWETIRPLLGDAPFRTITLHRAVDPSAGPFVAPSAADVARFGIRFTDWFPTRAGALEDLGRHDVSFAPRLREGIGLAFLEAMAMGMLVVAADRPTMSEYIVPGVNGLLYAPGRREPLDFARHAECGAEARRTVERGFRRWQRSIPALLDFVATPAARLPVRAPFLALDPAAPEPAAGAPDPDRRRDAASRRPLPALAGRALADPVDREELGLRCRAGWERARAAMGPLRAALRRTRRERVELRGAGRPAGLAAADGLAPGARGAWTTAGRVVLTLAAPVRRVRAVTLHVGEVSPALVGATLRVAAGGLEHAHRLVAGRQRVELRLRLPARRTLGAIELALPDAGAAGARGVALTALDIESRRW